MDKQLRDAFDKEMSLGKQFFSQKQFDTAFHHFERAHVLGQYYVLPHVKTHLWMFIIGLRTGNLSEIAGQLLRLPLGVFGSATGKIPKGNTGGANVKLTATMEIPDDLQKYLDNGEANTKNGR